MKKFFTKIAGVALGLAMAIGVGVAVANSREAVPVHAADSGISAEEGKFVIDFYDSTNLTTTQGGSAVDLTTVRNKLKVYGDITKSDVVTAVSKTGTVVTPRAGGMLFGTGTASNSSANTLTITIGGDYAVTKLTLYAAVYESGVFKLNGNNPDNSSDCTYAAKAGAISTITKPLVWDNLGTNGSGITSLAFTKHAATTGTSNQKRMTIYAIVCEYGSSGPKVNSVTLSKTSVKMDLNSSTNATITVDAEKGAEYTLVASTSSSSIATASISGTTLNVSSKSTYGTAIITVTAGVRSATLTVKVCNPNQLLFLEPCTDLDELVDGETYVFGAHYNSKLVAMKPAVENINTTGGTNNKCRGIEIDTSWKDTFGETTVHTARVDLNDYGIELAKANSKYTMTLLSGKLLGYPGSGTAPEEGGTSTEWNIALSSVNIGTFRITNAATTNRGLGYQVATSAFGAYATSNLSKDSEDYCDIEIYKVVDVDEITKLTITCFDNGSYSTDWTTLKSSFEGITNLAWKAYYKHAAYDMPKDTGQVIALENTDLAIAQFASKYDYIIHKYNKTDEQDFIQRLNTEYDLSKAAQIITNNNESESGNMILIISAISLVSITAVGGCFILRKRKER